MATKLTKRGKLDNEITYEFVCDTPADLQTGLRRPPPWPPPGHAFPAGSGWASPGPAHPFPALHKSLTASDAGGSGPPRSQKSRWRPSGPPGEAPGIPAWPGSPASSRPELSRLRRRLCVQSNTAH